MNSYIEQLFLDLVEWRDSATTKRKARAIQRVIDKKYNALNVCGKEVVSHFLKVNKLKLSAWSEW